MEFQTLKVGSRESRGKGPARRIRRKGLVPAVIYGNKVENIAISVNPKELSQALSGPLRTNTVLNLQLKDGKDVHALVKDHQYHPVSRELLHVDFYSVSLERSVTVEVPLKTVGRSIGEQTGGVLSRVHRVIPVECLPTDIPACIEVDISNLDLNQTIEVKDLEQTDKYKILLPETDTIVSVVAPTAVVEEEAAEEGTEEGAAAQEGEKAEGDKEKGEKAEPGESSESEGKKKE